LWAFITEAFPFPSIINNELVYPGVPVFPGTGLVVKSIDWESFTGNLPVDPLGSDTSAPVDTYDTELRVTVTYGLALKNDEDPSPQDETTFLEVSADASGTFFSDDTPIQSVWVDPGGGANEPVTDVNLPLAIAEPIVEWTVRWNQIPGAFFDGVIIGRMRNALGKVNSEVMGLLRNAPVDTILFIGYSFRQQFTWRTGFAGAPPIQLEMKFQEKNFEGYDGTAVTHQHTHRPGVGWRRLLRNGDPLFRTTDLRDIWT
jgi:hypothetical protein